MQQDVIIGFDAKRIVRNATGLGNYGRTLVNDIVAVNHDSWKFRLYAPDPGRSDLREKVLPSPRVSFSYPQVNFGFQRSLWRIGQGIVQDMQRDGVQALSWLDRRIAPWVEGFGYQGCCNHS